MLTNPMLLGVLISGLWVLFAIPAGVYLILCYQKTRMNGFIWLLVSIVVWPLVARGLTLTINMAGASIMSSRGLPASSYLSGVLLVSLAETLIGGVLLCVACIVLYRQIVARTTPQPVS